MGGCLQGVSRFLKSCGNTCCNIQFVKQFIRWSSILNELNPYVWFVKKNYRNSLTTWEPRVPLVPRVVLIVGQVPHPTLIVAVVVVQAGESGINMSLTFFLDALASQ